MADYAFLTAISICVRAISDDEFAVELFEIHGLQVDSPEQTSSICMCEA